MRLNAYLLEAVQGVVEALEAVGNGPTADSVDNVASRVNDDADALHGLLCMAWRQNHSVVAAAFIIKTAVRRCLIIFDEGKSANSPSPVPYNHHHHHHHVKGVSCLETLSHTLGTSCLLLQHQDLARKT